MNIRPELRLALEALNCEFAYRVDIGLPESVADLFVEDGWYGWGVNRSVGREAIRQAYRARAARGLRTARHICTNLRIGPIDDDGISGRSIMTIFAEDGPPPHPANPLLIVDVEDRYVQMGGRWLYRSRQLTDIFADPARTAVLPLKPPEATS